MQNLPSERRILLRYYSEIDIRARIFFQVCDCQMKMSVTYPVNREGGKDATDNERQIEGALFLKKFLKAILNLFHSSYNNFGN